MKQIKIIFISALLYTLNINSKLLIITHSYSRPDFIEIQNKTFKKFMLDEYEFVVFNDSPDANMEKEIANKCASLGIKCIRIPQEIHTRPYLYRFPGEQYPNACTRCADVVQYSLDILGFNHNGLVMIIDSDMFLIKKFGAKDFMKDYCIAGVKQSRGHVNYLWNGLVLLDMSSLPEKRTLNFNCGIIDNQPLDVGGYLYEYFTKHKEITPLAIDLTHSDHFLCAQCQDEPLCDHNDEFLRSLDFNTDEIEFIKNANNIEFLAKHSFLHYRGGTNWDRKSARYHEIKTKALDAFMKKILS